MTFLYIFKADLSIMYLKFLNVSQIFLYLKVLEVYKNSCSWCGCFIAQKCLYYYEKLNSSVIVLKGYFACVPWLVITICEVQQVTVLHLQLLSGKQKIMNSHKKMQDNDILKVNRDIFLVAA